MRITKVLLAVLAGLSIQSLAYGQERSPLPAREQSQYLVSIKAGMVNAAEGDVAVKRAQGDWEMVVVGDTLAEGDQLSTGADSRAEVLLNPGSYLRLFGETAFSFYDTSIDGVTVNLTTGAALVEVVAPRDLKGTIVTVITPHGEFAIIKGGLYRFNISEEGESEVLVYKGRLAYPDPGLPAKKAEWVAIPRAGGRAVVACSLLKEGKKLVFVDRAPRVVAFDKKQQDDFDLWSRERAATLIAANKRLTDHVIRRHSVFASSWFYNPFLGCYTFVPIYYGFYSPYGGHYSSCGNSWYPRPRRGYPYPPNSGSWGGGNTASGGGVSRGGSSVTGGPAGRAGGGAATGSTPVGGSRDAAPVSPGRGGRP